MFRLLMPLSWLTFALINPSNLMKWWEMEITHKGNDNSLYKVIDVMIPMDKYICVGKHVCVCACAFRVDVGDI